MSADSPPLFLLGVRRSGTTLLRVMLDRHPSLAVPDESYFVPQLAERHGDYVDADAFVDDLRRLPTIAEWGVSPDDVRARLPSRPRLGEAISAVYESYAEARGKVRWGDKTPMYMQYLPLLERLFPRALFVHLVRDGRDAAVSFLSMPAGVVTRTWAHPRSAAEFACQWRLEVEAARALGTRVGTRYLEVFYEQLVAEPEATLRGICTFAGLSYDRALLDYAGNVDVSKKPHQQRLRQPPTPGVRDWRNELTAADAGAFEDVAGDLLRELGYPADGSPTTRGRARLASYRARSAAWRGAGRATRRSPLWKRRHPILV